MNTDKFISSVIKKDIEEFLNSLGINPFMNELFSNGNIVISFNWNNVKQYNISVNLKILFDTNNISLSITKQFGQSVTATNTFTSCCSDEENLLKCIKKLFINAEEQKLFK